MKKFRSITLESEEFFDILGITPQSSNWRVLTSKDNINCYRNQIGVRIQACKIDNFDTGNKEDYIFIYNLTNCEEYYLFHIIITMKNMFNCAKGSKTRIYV